MHPSMKLYMKAKIKCHAFLTSEVDAYEWSFSCFDNFTPGDIVSGIHCTAG
jgi:hypothetical protein